MKTQTVAHDETNRSKRLPILGIMGAALLALALLPSLMGCGSSSPAKKQQNQDFFTSGSRDADQRAQQRMAQAGQLSGEGTGDKNATKAVVADAGSTNTNSAEGGTNKPALAPGKLALFDRLGGENGISNIVADFLPRVLHDPRVNFDRTDVKHGGLSFEAGKSETWSANSTNVARLQLHFIEFIALATGGPSRYEGKQLEPTHAHMHISNAEFDATLGDLKASLDRLQIANTEQKELLAIVESTRPEIVTEH